MSSYFTHLPLVRSITSRAIIRLWEPGNPTNSCFRPFGYHTNWAGFPLHTNHSGGDILLAASFQNVKLWNDHPKMRRESYHKFSVRRLSFGDNMGVSYPIQDMKAQMQIQTHSSSSKFLGGRLFSWGKTNKLHRLDLQIGRPAYMLYLGHHCLLDRRCLSLEFPGFRTVTDFDTRPNKIPAIKDHLSPRPPIPPQPFLLPSSSPAVTPSNQRLNATSRSRVREGRCMPQATKKRRLNYN